MPGIGCAHYPFIVSITEAAGKEYKSNARGTAKRVGTAALGCPAERSYATFHNLNPGRAALDRTAEGGCPHALCGSLALLLYSFPAAPVIDTMNGVVCCIQSPAFPVRGASISLNLG